jgi:hypothetical protein
MAREGWPEMPKANNWNFLAVVCANFSESKCNFLVVPCKKRDIVDTFSHASRAFCHILYKQTSFPTTWRKAERAKLKVMNCITFWLYSSVGTKLICGYGGMGLVLKSGRPRL